LRKPELYLRIGPRARHRGLPYGAALRLLDSG
jgi:hypothetical protein